MRRGRARQHEKLRAELKPGALRELEIEVEPHLAVLDEHVRDASERREVVEVADRQHRRAAHRRHDGGDLRRRDARR